MFNKSIIASLTGIAIAIPLSAFALTIKTAQSPVVASSEIILGDLYTAGRTVTVFGTVTGDLVAGGGALSISGRVMQDVLAGGGVIDLTGQVGDDVRVAGGNIVVSGQIAGDLIAAGGSIRVLPGGIVGGDIVIAGGNVTIDGRVQGSAKVASGSLTLNNTIGGNVDVVGSKIFVGPGATIGGHLSYRTDEDITIDPAANINGGVEKLPPLTKGAKSERGAAKAGALVVLFVIKFAILLFSALLMTSIFRNRVQKITELGWEKFGWNILTGFVVLVVVPVAGVIAAMTVLGLFVAILLALWYAVMLAFAWIVSSVLAGTYVWKLITKDNRVHWKSVTTGVIVTSIAALIPVIGWLACLFLLFWSFGTLATYWYSLVWKNR